MLVPWGGAFSYERGTAGHLQGHRFVLTDTPTDYSSDSAYKCLRSPLGGTERMGPEASFQLDSWLVRGLRTRHTLEPLVWQWGH